MSTNFDINALNKKLDTINDCKIKIETLNNAQEKVRKHIDAFPDGEVLCPTCTIS